MSFQNEKIVETKTCKWTGEKFHIHERDLEMLDKLSPVIGGQKLSLQTPDLSPKAREINRLMFRNERKFYKIKLENGKEEISTIHPEMRKRIINIEEFNNYDFTKEGIQYSGNFFDDFKKLLLKSPNHSKLIANMENSDFCNQEVDDKNCYLNSGGHGNEDSMYNTFAIETKDTLDNYWIIRSSIVYESLNVFSSQKIFFSQEIKDSYNCFFSHDLIGCQNVIFGNSLTNANYIYKNKILEKDDWEKKYKEFKDKLKTKKGIIELKKEFEKFLNEVGKKEVFIEKSENSYGNIITNSKNSFSVFYGEHNENLRYANILWDTKDSMDINSFADGSKLYNVASSYKYINGISSALVLDSAFSYYSFGIDTLNYSLGCFGFGLKNKSYLILNKEYKKEEWESITQKVIKELQDKGEWGRFLKPELSPYPYNDSVAMEYHPIKKVITLDGNKILGEKIIRNDGIGIVYILEKDKFISKAIIDFGGEEKINTFWRTKEVEVNIPENMEKVPGNQIPEIDDIDESILNKVIICEESGRPFRIVKKELEFYKRYGLPIPALHYDERHIERIKKKSNDYYFVA